MLILKLWETGLEELTVRMLVCWQNLLALHKTTGENTVSVAEGRCHHPSLKFKHIRGEEQKPFFLSTHKKLVR